MCPSVAPNQEKLNHDGGDVIVMHDGIDPHRWRDPASMLEALPKINARLHERNLEPVRLDELFGVTAYVS